MVIHPPYRRPLLHGLLLVALCAAALAAAWLPALQFSLPASANTSLHTGLELASVVVALLVFVIGWASFDRQRGSLVPVASSVFLGVAVLDFVHLMVFEGMPMYMPDGGVGQPTVTFLGARVLVALAMVALAVMPWGNPPSRGRLVLLFAGALLLALGLSAWSLASPTPGQLLYVPGQGLTPLKIGLEYGIIALNLLAAGGFLRRLAQPQSFAVVPLLTASLVMALSELCFTLYASASDQFINLGHVLKIVAYALVFRAIVLEAVRKPYDDLEQAQAELRESERRYRLLFANNMDALVVLDSEGRVVDANPAAADTLGLPLAQLQGADGWSFVAADDPRLPPLVEAFRKDRRARGELRIRRADGSCFEADIAAVIYPDAAGRSLGLWSMRDVTERQRARDQILQLNATLEERVRQRTAQLEALNAELEAFSYSVAHDLRAPLGAVAGFAEALGAQGERLDDKGRRYLERICTSAHRMAEMIDALLELGRVSRTGSQPQEVDLGQLAQGILDELRQAHPQRQVTTRVAGGLGVQGDPRLLRLALQNLLGNAWKFTAGRPDACIEVGCEERQGQRVFHVRDNGAGFDMEAARHLFGAFQRLHDASEFPGHGVGLANVRRIVHLHGGQIWAEAQPGAGATFHFTLPAAPLPPALGTIAP